MGVLPLQFKEGTTAQTLKLDGTETYDIVGLDANLKPQQDLTLRITRKDGTRGERAACAAASIRRSRSTTTSTAAFCRTCCGSWWRRRERSAGLRPGALSGLASRRVGDRRSKRS